MGEGDALPAVVKLITQDQIERYADASGDHNPVHVDAQFAAASQFGRTIAHGMLIAAAVSEAMTAAFDTVWADTGRLKLRFKSPVFPGDTITSSGRVKTVHERDVSREVVCSVAVHKQDGDEAVTGEATVLLQTEHEGE